MTSAKMALATGLAAVACALLMTRTVGGIALLAGLAPVFGISAIVLALAAFVVSWGKRSFAIAVMLAVGGIMFAIPALIATGYLTVIVFPGPIFGVIFGMAIFGLGVAKGISSATAARAVVR